MSNWTPPPLPPELMAATRDPLVGRSRELETLEETWQAVEGGQRRVLFIGGEPGAGKTRLAAEAGAKLRDEGAVVLLGKCVAEFGIPYQPFVQTLDQLLTGTEAGALAGLVPDSATELSRLTAHVARHRPDLSPGARGDVEYRREMFESYADLVAAVSVERPIVLILEDLHWARSPTLQLLTHLVQSTSTARLLILATLRTALPDRSDELTYTVAEMYRINGVRRIDLGGLDVDDIADYLAAVSGVPKAQAQSAATILRDQTAGNPFFVRELWKEVSTLGGVEALVTGGIAAPTSIRETLEARFAAFDDAGLSVVEHAALIGDRFELSVLLASTDSAQTAVLSSIDTATEIGLFDPGPSLDGRHSFVHPLARQAVIGQMTPSRRAQAHAQIAGALEARDANSTEAIARLVFHYAMAAPLGFEPQAAKYLIRAAEAAAQSLAYEEAADSFARAAEMTPTNREGLMLSAASNHVRAGDFSAARAIYEPLGRSDDPVVRLRAAIGYEDASWRPGRVGDTAVELLARALKDSPADLSNALNVRASASLGRALTFTGADEEGKRVGDRAVALARDLGDQELLAHCLQTSLWHTLVPETAPAQLDTALELTSLASASGDYEALGLGAYHRAVIAYLHGGRSDWIAAQSDLRRVARSTGQPFFEYMVGCMDASQRYIRGDFSGTRAMIESLASIGSAFGQDDAEGSYGLQVFMVQRATGALEQIRPLISGNETTQDHWAPGLLALYTELGLEAATARVLESVLESHLVPESQPAQWPAFAAFAADAITLLRSRKAAQQLLPRLERYQGCNLVAGQFVAVFGSADRYIAQLKALLGDPSAADLFQSALDMDTRMGSLIHQAETLAAYALYLESSTDRLSRDRAREFRDEAIRIAQSNGQRRVLVMLDVSLELPGGLTPREADVIRLVAEGLSNREIGERLHLSHNTAANHVRSILIKTGAKNRTRAAIYAAQNNLLD